VLLPLGERLGLIPRSAMLTSPARPVRELARIALTLRIVGTIHHAEWLYRGRGKIPATRIDRRAPKPIDDIDLEICRRLSAAYAEARKNNPTRQSDENMWSWIFDTRQRQLATALEGGDVRALAMLLTSMFRQDFVLGMATGSLTGPPRSRLRSRIWLLKTLDGLVSLAESLGVVLVENPEQGGHGLALEGGVEGLFDRLERGLGFRLDFPDVGAPSGLAVDGRLLTPDTPDQLYAAVRLDEAIRLHLDRDAQNPEPTRIVEIGGGYGGMCHWLLQRRDAVARYTIVDLPIVNAIQGSFLARALGPERVSFFGEAPSQVRILPDFALAEVETPFDVLANKDSMPEMPPEAMREYLEWGGENCEGLFYSYNQEAAAEFLGEAQGVVHRTVATLGHFERLHRDRAWVRRGYVEEIYTPSGASNGHVTTADG
jgi:hypothetical protein